MCVHRLEFPLSLFPLLFNVFVAKKHCKQIIFTINSVNISTKILFILKNNITLFSHYSANFSMMEKYAQPNIFVSWFFDFFLLFFYVKSFLNAFCISIYGSESLHILTFNSLKIFQFLKIASNNNQFFYHTRLKIQVLNQTKVF